MGCESASCLDTTGGSASGGRFRWALDTLSLTSLAAASISAPTSNSTVILLLPSLLIEVKDLIPEIPLIDSSRGSVIWASMTSALAPT